MFTEIDKAAIRENIMIIADQYGIEHQLFKTLEELGELTSALATGDEKELIGEIADVYIMLSQMEYLTGIEHEVRCAILEKLIRQNRRMMGEL